MNVGIFIYIDIYLYLNVYICIVFVASKLRSECSIWSYQLNIWGDDIRLILGRGKVLGACAAFTTG